MQARRLTGRPRPDQGASCARGRGDARFGRDARGNRSRGARAVLLGPDRPYDRRRRGRARWHPHARGYGRVSVRRGVAPVSVEVRGHILATPPPASGGLTSLQMVALFDRLERRGQGRPGRGAPSGWIEALLEIDKAVWEERLTLLADPRFMTRPRRDMLADRRAPRTHSARFGSRRALPHRSRVAWWPPTRFAARLTWRRRTPMATLSPGPKRTAADSARV